MKHARFRSALWSSLLMVGFCGLLIPTAAGGQSSAEPISALISPRSDQLDLEVGSLFGFTGPGSIVRVREFDTKGTGLHFSYLGMNSEQMPTGDIRFWFTDTSALHFRLRYFNINGTRFFRGPFFFNGSQIAGGQTIHSDPWEWFAGGLYYERRLSRLWQRYEDSWPPWLQHWDVRGMIGIEYTYIDFRLNGGTARVTKASKGEETKEDFYHQSMPLPTIGIDAMHRLGENFLLDASVSGNWINHVNSLRNEGGTVYASQSGIEAHARVYYSNPQYLGPIQPMLGAFVYTYSQNETSHEDGNFIRWMSYGPEVGINCSF